MDAKILYKVYETTKEKNAPDLTLGLAILKDEHPEMKITHEQDKNIREFIGRHGQELAAAFPDKEAFEAAVAAGIKADEEAENQPQDGADLPGEGEEA